MKIHKLTKRGFNHKDYCEDFLLVHSINDQYLIAAVFDGCSSGVDSHFASALLGKALRKVCLNQSELTLNVDLLTIASNLFFETVQLLQQLVTSLMLNAEEILSTMIILVLDIETNKAEIIATGDGFVSINGEHYIIDQNNQPDYLAYYLTQLGDRQQFDLWFASLKNKWSVAQANDICISTDGILSFQSDDGYQSARSKEILLRIVDYLTVDTYLALTSTMLSRKCNILKNKHELNNYDDLGIVRIINTTVEN